MHLSCPKFGGNIICVGVRKDLPSLAKLVSVVGFDKATPKFFMQHEKHSRPNWSRFVHDELHHCFIRDELRHHFTCDEPRH